MKKITINGIKKEYDVIIDKNLLNSYGFSTYAKKVIIIDKNVYRIYKTLFDRKFNNEFSLIIQINAKEKNKSFKTYSNIIKKLLINNIDRDYSLIAIGGGVTLDLAGYIASTYKRGIDLIYVPTTLLSMVDASIGSKNGINVMNYKNQVGSFYEPSLVLIDIDFLNSLDKRNINSGLCEVLKCSILKDKELYEMLLNDNFDLSELIYKTINVKKYFVELDPYDQGERFALNLGHTYGHALESYYKGKLLHGECVGIGLLKVVSKPLADKIKVLLDRWNIDYKIIDKNLNLNSFLLKDKKIRNKKIKVVKSNKFESYHFVDMEI